MLFRRLDDPDLAQNAYLIGCPATGEAVIIDPERDIDRPLAAAEAEGLRIAAVAETHIHADFLSGARALATRTGARLYLSREGEAAGWPSRWAREAAEDGRLAVTFLGDGERFQVGNLTFTALHTPGHTPEHLSFLVRDGAAGLDMGMVSGDFVFVGDLGRPDLLESAAGQANSAATAARQLYSSARALADRPGHLQIWPAHGAGSPCGKALGAVPQSVLAYERATSPALRRADEGEAAFCDYILADQPAPPLYFGRMKQLNRDGVPDLVWPTPRQLAAQEITAIGSADPAPTVIDCRADRETFAARHLPGSLHIPLDRSFAATAGSLIAEPATPLALVVAPARLDAAIRALIRIGLDNVVAHIDPDSLARHFEGGGKAASLSRTDFKAAREVAREAAQDGAALVDVRNPGEYAAGHLPGAWLAPLGRLPEHLETLPADRPLMVHCGTGRRAAAAASFLAARGREVMLVEGRLADAAAEGPLATGPAAPLARSA